MLRKLFGRREAAPDIVLPRVPEGSRVYAVGDIHGRIDLLRMIHTLIRADAGANPAPRNVVVYLGDYIDRGPDSAAVVDYLIDQPIPGFTSMHLLGNHEDTLIRFLSDASVTSQWLGYGGSETLLSYGVRPPYADSDRDILRAQVELRERFPERHLRFFRGLKLCHAEGDFFFVHAGIRPGVALDAQTPEDCLWIRDRFLYSEEDHGRIVVHGHTITEAPDVRRNRIGIDTGAFATGRLTCLVLAGERWSFIQT
jgi:serine/threonine protein phosphatase 1